MEQGYRVIEGGPWVMIGNEREAILAKSPHESEPPVQLVVDSFEVVDSSCGVVGDEVHVRPGDWLRLEFSPSVGAAFFERLELAADRPQP